MVPRRVRLMIFAGLCAVACIAVQPTILVFW